MTVPARLCAWPIRAYRLLVSPLLPARCRFAPTCSTYALQALEQHGAARGSWLALRRLGRCQPFNPGGHDPVPPPATRVRRRASAASRAGRDDAVGSPTPPRPRSLATHRTDVPRAPRPTVADLGALS